MHTLGALAPLPPLPGCRELTPFVFNGMPDQLLSVAERTLNLTINAAKKIKPNVQA